jgi:hypothetical protein
MANAWKRLYMAAEERCLDSYHCGCVGLANVQWKAYTTDASNTHQRLKEGVEEASGSDVQRAQDDFLRRQSNGWSKRYRSIYIITNVSIQNNIRAHNPLRLSDRYSTSVVKLD